MWLESGRGMEERQLVKEELEIYSKYIILFSFSFKEEEEEEIKYGLDAKRV